MFEHAASEAENLAAEARLARQMSAAQRVEVFTSIMRMVAATWQTLPFEEQWRRLQIGAAIDGVRDVPWWSSVPAAQRPCETELQRLLAE